MKEKVFLMIGENDNIDLTHYQPSGLPKEMLDKGLLFDEIPENKPNEILKYSRERKEFYYEQIVRELTTEEKLASQEQAILELTKIITGGTL